MAEGKQVSDRLTNVTPTWEIANEYNQKNWPSVIKDNQIFWLLLIEELEYRAMMLRVVLIGMLMVGLVATTEGCG